MNTNKIPITCIESTSKKKISLFRYQRCTTPNKFVYDLRWTLYFNEKTISFKTKSDEIDAHYKNIIIFNQH